MSIRPRDPYAEIPETLWWFSFADPHRPEGTQFLGACIVGPTTSLHKALERTRELRINPGGEVRGQALPRERLWAVPKDYCDRLLTRDECEDFDRLVRDRVGISKEDRS